MLKCKMNIRIGPFICLGAVFFAVIVWCLQLGRLIKITSMIVRAESAEQSGVLSLCLQVVDVRNKFRLAWIFRIDLKAGHSTFIQDDHLWMTTNACRRSFAPASSSLMRDA